MKGVRRGLAASRLPFLECLTRGTVPSLALGWRLPPWCQPDARQEHGRARQNVVGQRPPR